MSDAGLEQTYNPSWWPLALSSDVTSRSPIARRCGQLEFALYRNHAGVAFALEDRCIHRRAPLSLGRVTEGGDLQCGYHGWCFEGSTGRCSAITTLDPSEKAPPRYRVPSFAVKERQGFTYVWIDADVVPTAEPPAFETVGNFAAEGSMRISMPHEHVVAALLDSPALVLQFGDLTLLPEMLGDPVKGSAWVEVEYGLTSEPPAHRTQSPADFPYLARIAVEALTGQAQISVLSIDERCISQILLAPVPARAAVTELAWRSFSNPEAGGGGQRIDWKLRPHVDPEGLMQIRDTIGSNSWREIAKVPPSSLVSPFGRVS